MSCCLFSTAYCIVLVFAREFCVSVFGFLRDIAVLLFASRVSSVSPLPRFVSFSLSSLVIVRHSVSACAGCACLTYQVVTVLKSLLEDKEMLLADGRRLLDASRAAVEAGTGVIPIHPNFRLWALANRPGFPFLGNQFFRCVSSG
jgi:hypothetical protein